MAAAGPIHVPVMLAEVLAGLSPQPGGIFVDGTLGGGGHTRALAQRVGPGGRIIALDRDPAAIEAADTNLSDLPVRPLHANFCDLPEVLVELGLEVVDGILLDLGLSSDQLADMGADSVFLRPALWICGSIPCGASRPGICWSGSAPNTWPI